MNRLITRWEELNLWLKIIVFFCLIGSLSNLILVCRDLSSSGILLRLHSGFLILYVSQVVFIFLRERFVWVIAVVQGVLALMTNADFTFVPVVRMIGRASYIFLNPSVEFWKVYKYILISASFTIQMLVAYAEFSLLPKPAAKTPQEAAPSTAK